MTPVHDERASEKTSLDVGICASREVHAKRHNPQPFSPTCFSLIEDTPR